MDREHDRTLHIGFEDEDTLYFDLFDSANAWLTPEGNDTIAGIMLNLKTGKVTIRNGGEHAKDS
ncbi:MAG: hypothetical protein V1780_05045 [Chloroflexota bacterium]